MFPITKNPNQGVYLCVVFLDVLLSGLGVGGEPARSPQEPLSQLQQAWQRRERSTTTLDCQWSHQTVFGARTWSYRDDYGNTFFLPSEDLKVSGHGRLRLRGDRHIRYELQEPSPVPVLRRFVERTYISVQKGKQQKSFYSGDEAGGEPRFAPQGYIEAETATLLPDTHTLHLWPVLLLYRSSWLAKQLDLGQLVPRGPLRQADREYFLFESRQEGFKTQLLVDRDRDWIPVRLAMLRLENGDWQARNLLEISYAAVDGKLWRLAGWKSAILGMQGSVREQREVMVERLVLNEPIADSVFDIAFPPGTVIRDNQKRQHYVVLEGDQRRLVTQEELLALANGRVTPRQLQTTPVGQALAGTGRGPWWVWGSLGLLGLLILGSGWWYWRVHWRQTTST